MLPRSGLLRCLSNILSRRAITTGPAAFTSPLHYVDGQRVEALNKNITDDLPVLEPHTGKALCRLRTAAEDDVNRAVKSAREAFPIWSQMTGNERGKILRNVAQRVRENQEELARVETHDTGKPLWEARLDIEGCADTIEFYAGLAPTVSGQHIPLSGGSFAYTRREPLGVVGGIGAWNYPFQMVSWKSSPALATGNTIVFKPSQLTPFTAVMLAEIFTDAGLPKGCFNIIQGAGDTGTLLSNHPDIAKMSFTGSVNVGSKVMAACAKGIKHVTLELGGKSPLIVFEDADVDNAVKGAMMANFLTQGQVCSNGTRVYVHKSIMEPFLEKLVAKTQKMKIGDPFDEDTHVGSMISKEQAEKTLHFIDLAQKEGGTVACGGERVVPSESLAGGHFISPCIMTNVKDDSTLAKEEVFGSVMAVFSFEDEEDVLRRANDTPYGLAAGLFTKDLNRAHRVAAQLEAGSLYINNYNVYPCEIPFGGVKKSGIGRENGAVTLDFYTQVKTVYVEAGDVWCPY